MEKWWSMHSLRNFSIVRLGGRIGRSATILETEFERNQKPANRFNLRIERFSGELEIAICTRTSLSRAWKIYDVLVLPIYITHTTIVNFIQSTNL